MQGLIGRRASHPEILEVRELTLEEVKATPRAPIERLKKLRDSHHAAARLFAMGMRLNEVATEVGYSYNGLSMLYQSPAFQELIASYREMVSEEWKGSVDEYYQMLTSVRRKSLRLISDKLDEAEPGDIPLNQLTAIHSDAADRSGYPKRKEHVNMNLDFADRLDAAVRRSREVKEIEATAVETRSLTPRRDQETLPGTSSSSQAVPDRLRDALPADGAGEEAGGSPSPSTATRPSPSIQKLLPPTRQEKALLRRA
jgi:hypothetical protein